ncbi:MAG: flagellar biosynthetic protein FliR [Gammaproteobacteria bacterium]|nr:flagellar biosynthetic protein FliR [Gammaproteobacteria bacterium]
MAVDVSIAWITAVLLLTVRFGVILYLAPMVAAAKVPKQILVLWVVALSVGLLLVSNVSLIEFNDVAELIKAMLSELALGALMAFALVAAFAAFLLGGRIVDFQMGFGVAGLIDPATNAQAPLIGSILNLIAIMVFYSLNAHHYLLRGLAFSIEKIPPGAWLGDFDIAVVIAYFGTMFSFAIALVAPIIFSILLLDVGLAVMARTMPQMNVFIVSIPLKIFTGLSIAALSLYTITPFMEKIFEAIFVFWQSIIPS